MAKKPKTRLVGFARLRITDPEKLRQLAVKAGKAAQKKYGKRIRWTKAQARAHAARGGKAVQKQYQKEGHPLQIAQARREALSRKIREGMKNRKRKQQAPPPVTEMGAGVDLLPAVSVDLLPEPEPEKDVANG